MAGLSASLADRVNTKAARARLSQLKSKLASTVLVLTRAKTGVARQMLVEIDPHKFAPAPMRLSASDDLREIASVIGRRQPRALVASLTQNIAGRISRAHSNSSARSACSSKPPAILKPSPRRQRFRPAAMAAHSTRCGRLTLTPKRKQPGLSTGLLLQFETIDRD